MKILVFEYFTANGITEQSIVSEGKAILEALLSDLDGIECDYLISERLNFNDLKYANKIIINEDLKQWLKKNIKKYDTCVFVASEEKNALYEITKIIEDNSVQIVGSNSNAVEICTDKFKTYETLKGAVKQAKTIKTNRKKTVLDNFSYLKPLILKPNNGVDCQDIILVKDIETLDKINSEVIFQEYIEGEDYSLSLLKINDKIIPLSLNKQIIRKENNEFSYCGAILPVDHPLKEDAIEIAKKVINKIDGLNGFISVDFIFNEEVHFLEINARFATPYVGLRKIINFNIIKTLLNDSAIPKEIKYKNKIKLIKENNELKIKKIT